MQESTTPDTLPEGDEFDPDTDLDRGPLRRCAATRVRLPKERMIRFVVGPDRQAVPDLAQRLPGRGIWLSADRDVLEGGRARSALARAARGPVTVPPDLPAVLQAALARRFADTLGLARRAGQAICGYAKAREWLAGGRAALVVQASDGSAEERARFIGAREVPVVAPLTAASLGAIFGRDHAVHVAVAAGRLAETLAAEAGRLAGVAGTTAAPATSFTGPAAAGKGFDGAPHRGRAAAEDADR